MPRHSHASGACVFVCSADGVGDAAAFGCACSSVAFHVAEAEVAAVFVVVVVHCGSGASISQCFGLPLRDWFAASAAWEVVGECLECWSACALVWLAVVLL